MGFPVHYWRLSLSLSLIAATASVFYPPNLAMASMYSVMDVDSTYETIENFEADSWITCVANCEIIEDCSAAAFDIVTKNCGSVKRETVTWKSSTKRIHVAEGKTCKTFDNLIYYKSLFHTRCVDFTPRIISFCLTLSFVPGIN